MFPWKPKVVGMWLLIQQHLCCSLVPRASTIHVPLLPHTQDPLEFQAREPHKYFVVGDHVKVVAGRHKACRDWIG